MPERSSTSATSWAWTLVERETDDSRLVLRGRPEDPQALDALQDLVGPGDQQPLVTSDGVHADAVEIIDGRAQADGRDDRRRAGLELGRQVARLEAIQQHAADHAPAAQERRHGLQQLALAVEHADARRPQHLVAAEDEEIDVQGLHVGLLVRHALGPVQQRQAARPGARGE